MLRGLLIVLVFLAAGELLSRFVVPAIPGSLAGMVLLAVALKLEWIRVETVQATADLLVRNLGLFFVPAGVGIVLYGEVLREQWLPIVVGCVASTVAVLAVVGLVQQRLERR